MAEGTKSDDANGVVRDNSATGLLGIENFVVKAISGSIDYGLRAPLAAPASIFHPFRHGRHSPNNIVDFNSYARSYFSRPSSGMPTLIFTDFAAAFPSVVHEWIFLTLVKSGWPTGFSPNKL